MAKRDQSTFEDIVDIVSRLPWWIGMVLAGMSYIILHHYAGMEVPVPTPNLGWNPMIEKQMYKTFAYFGQYLLSVAFLFGALISAMKQFR